MTVETETLSSTDNVVSLVINRLTKEMYNELCATPGEMDKHKNELFLVEDEDFDVYNKKIINVKQPEISTDAVNLQYLELQYLLKNQAISLIELSSVYSGIIKLNLPNGSEYIDNNGDVYRKNILTSDTTTWQIVKIKDTDNDYPDMSKMKIGWDEGSDGVEGFGWNFYYNSTRIGGLNRNPLLDSLIYESLDGKVYLSATPWYKSDSIVKKSILRSTLSTITAATSTADVINILSTLYEAVK